MAEIDKGTDRTEILVVGVVPETVVAAVGQVTAIAAEFIVVQDTGGLEAFRPDIDFFEVGLASAEPGSTGEEGHIVVVAPSASAGEVVHITNQAPFAISSSIEEVHLCNLYSLAQCTMATSTAFQTAVHFP